MFLKRSAFTTFGLGTFFLNFAGTRREIERERGANFSKFFGRGGGGQVWDWALISLLPLTRRHRVQPDGFGGQPHVVWGAWLAIAQHDSPSLYPKKHPTTLQGCQEFAPVFDKACQLCWSIQLEDCHSHTTSSSGVLWLSSCCHSPFVNATLDACCLQCLYKRQCRRQRKETVQKHGYGFLSGISETSLFWPLSRLLQVEAWVAGIGRKAWPEQASPIKNTYLMPKLHYPNLKQNTCSNTEPPTRPCRG